ncbi:MAG: hypothetical protein AMJ46_07095 [Latescibacteria bacterium DG_63]|nr:MAG: hypothetical protein AMJ46_07095 [Latescibacteria bacterium DG_63]
MFRRVAHVGIAVRDSERAAELMRELLDATLVETVVLKERGLRLTFLKIAGTNVELLEPLEGEGPVAKFLEKNGEGFHHIAFEVSDMEKALSRLRKAGVKLVEPAPSKGAHGDLVAFIRPSSMCGVLVELCEKRGES